MLPNTRRDFLATTSIAAAALGLGRARALSTDSTQTSTASAGPATESGLSRLFPTQDSALVQEMVMVAHGNLPRVQALVSRQPALAKAAFDWGFGDWETALGAASHVGSRPVAELLLANGARPTIFSACMLGQLEVVRAFIAASPGIERTKGPHGLTLAHHARMGGAAAAPIVEYLKTLDGADSPLQPAPLAPADMTRLTGTYRFGTRDDERIEVTEAKGVLSFTRAGRIARPIYHRGDLSFSPMGSDAVRIAFSTGATMTLTVFDPDAVLTATRQA